MAVAGGLVWSVAFIREKRALRAELEGMRAQLVELRARANDCQTATARREADFRAYDRLVDSLRAEVESFEALDARGVPGERYRDYLEAFDVYNEAVPVWESRADSLALSSDTCRQLAERHNVLADSLRRRVDALTRPAG